MANYSFTIQNLSVGKTSSAHFIQASVKGHIPLTEFTNSTVFTLNIKQQEPDL